MSAMGTALAYFSTCLVAYKYAARFAEKAPWWSKSVAVVGALTSIACFLMLAVPGSPAAIGFESWIMLFAWVAIGACFYFSRVSILRTIPEKNMQYMLLGTVDRPLLFTPKNVEEFEEGDAKSGIRNGTSFPIWKWLSHCAHADAPRAAGGRLCGLYSVKFLARAGAASTAKARAGA